MYKFEELDITYVSYKYGCSIEGKIIDFLNYYKIPKENVIKVRIISNSRATIIFETDGSKFEETEYRRFDV